MQLVCLGDSLTQGYGIELKEAWCNKLRSSAEIAVYNAGISGDTTAGMLARFTHDVISRKPTHVFIMGGTNDVYLKVRTADTLANIYAMVHQAKFHGIDFIIGVPTRAYSDQAEVDAFREALVHFCNEHEYKYIDMASNLVREDFLEDGVHPSVSGHKKMYDTVHSQLIKFMKI